MQVLSRIFYVFKLATRTENQNLYTDFKTLKINHGSTSSLSEHDEKRTINAGEAYFVRDASSELRVL